MSIQAIYCDCFKWKYCNSWYIERWTGDLKVNTNKFVVTASNGNTAIVGTLSEVGADKYKSAAHSVLLESQHFSTFTVIGATTRSSTLSVEIPEPQH